MNILKILNSPIPVAWFQHLCGVRWKHCDSENRLYPSKSTHACKNDAENPEFEIIYRSWFIAAKIGTELAGEPFYYVFFPACAWVFQINVARRTLIMLTTSMFIGQCLKDVLRRPRPASPPVVRLEAMYETEYGMPSTHVAAAVASSFSLFLFCSNVYEVPWNLGLFLCSCWSFTVAVSRIYLGMHTLLEVGAGAALSLAVVFSASPLVTWFEKMHLTSGLSTSVVVISLFLARLLFAIDSGIDSATGDRKWNTARGDTAEILGWCSGFLVGSKYAIEKGILSQLVADAKGATPFGAKPAFVRCLIRFAAGGVLLLPATFLLRKCLIRFFVYIHGHQHTSPDKAKRSCEVELPYKFFTTAVSGFFSTTAIPAVLQAVGVW